MKGCNVNPISNLHQLSLTATSNPWNESFSIYSTSSTAPHPLHFPSPTNKEPTNKQPHSKRPTTKPKLPAKTSAIQLQHFPPQPLHPHISNRIPPPNDSSPQVPSLTSSAYTRFASSTLVLSANSKQSATNSQQPAASNGQQTTTSSSSSQQPAASDQQPVASGQQPTASTSTTHRLPSTVRHFQRQQPANTPPKTTHPKHPKHYPPPPISCSPLPTLLRPVSTAPSHPASASK